MFYRTDLDERVFEGELLQTFSNSSSNVSKGTWKGTADKQGQITTDKPSVDYVVNFNNWLSRLDAKRFHLRYVQGEFNTVEVSSRFTMSLIFVVLFAVVMPVLFFAVMPNAETTGKIIFGIVFPSIITAFYFIIDTALWLSVDWQLRKKLGCVRVPKERVK